MFLLFLLLLPAIAVHEAAHAWAAWKLGDSTAKRLGRLSLNPARHLDIAGTLMLLFVHFGWGNPVPVDPRNFRRPLRDQALTAAAGPASNLALALATALILRILPAPGIFAAGFLFIQINLGLAFFNLLPLYPLDGSRILLFLLPARWQDAALRFYAHSPAILVGLLVGDWLMQEAGGASVFGVLFGWVFSLARFLAIG